MDRVIHYGFQPRDLTPEEVVSKFVPDGWEKLVMSLIDDLFEMGWHGHLTQVKEKYGGLRFYTAVDSPLFERIEQAERESYSTCMYCASPGHCRERGWIRIMCDDCYGEELSRTNE